MRLSNSNMQICFVIAMYCRNKTRKKAADHSKNWFRAKEPLSLCFARLAYTQGRNFSSFF